MLDAGADRGGVCRRFALEYTLAGMDVLLHRIGWSVQVPARRAAVREGELAQGGQRVRVGGLGRLAEAAARCGPGAASPSCALVVPMTATAYCQPLRSAPGGTVRCRRSRCQPPPPAGSCRPR